MMIYSFYQVQFVLAICTIVFARRFDRGNGLNIPAQRPMLHDLPANAMAEEVKASNDVSKSGRDATIKLFSPSPPSSNRSFSVGCSTQFNTIALATNVCLTGYYSPNHNIVISEAPICSDGSTPTMRYYHADGCSTKPHFESTTMPGPENCLWGGVAPERWSMIFCCGPEPTVVPDPDKYQRADPPVAVIDLRPVSDKDGIIDIRRECNDRKSFRRIGLTQRNVPVDTCITSIYNTLTIVREATCPNGTSAKLARFENINCNWGRISSKFGLVDILAKDIGTSTCLSPDTLDQRDQIRSIAFWCDGVSEAPLKALPGLFTRIGCADNKPSLRDASYQRARPDTCHATTLELLNPEKYPFIDPRRFSIQAPAICSNGSTATLALYKEKRCASPPNHFLELSPETLNKCFSFDDMSSWAFYCDGVPANVSSYTDRPQGALPAHRNQDSTQVGQYNFNDCRDDDEGKQRQYSVFKVPSKPDTCSTFPLSRKLSISRPALCANGTKAILALFNDPLCDTLPAGFQTVDDEKLDQCIEYKGMRSWSFWCTGEGVGVARQRQPPLIHSNPDIAHARPIKVTYDSSSPISVHLDKSQKPAYTVIPLSRHSSASATAEAVPGLKTVPYNGDHKEQLSVETRLKDIKPLGGQLSYTACTIGQKPKFLNVPLRFCNPIIPNQPIMISRPATCSNEKSALVAFYKQGVCEGKANAFAALDAQTSQQCFSYNNFTSWEFWCDPNGTRPPPPGIPQFSNSVVAGLEVVGTYHFWVPYEICLMIGGVGVVGVAFLCGMIFGLIASAVRAVVRYLKGVPVSEEELLEEGQLSEKLGLLEEAQVSDKAQLLDV